MFDIDIGKALRLDKFEKVLARFDRPPLKVYDNFCFDRRLEKPACEACLEVCRANAIEVSATGCRVDFSLCDGCGLCAAVCPAGVFEPAAGDGFLLAQIQRVVEKRRAAAFCCPKTKAKTDKKTDGSAIEVPCLGRLGRLAFLGTAAFGGTQVWLNDARCKDCELAAGLAMAQKTAAEVGRLLKAFDCELEVTFGRKPPKRFGLNGERPELPEAGKYGRRDFFAAAFREAVLTGMDLAEDTIEALLPKEQEILPYIVPAKHRHFLALVRRLNRLPSDDLITAAPLVQVEVSGDCTACGACAVVCPTKALTAEEDGQAGSLNFSLAYCLGCGLCRAACTENALSYRDAIEPAKLLTNKREPIYEFSLRKCPKCQQLFSSQKHDTCSFCRQRAAKITYDSWS